MRGIVWLDGEVPAPAAALGGKGAGLARLAAAGMPVPPGFVIMTAAVQALGRDGADRDSTLAAIVESWSRLAPGGEAVAVRSSAVDEDSESVSFAGLHETTLDVRRQEGLLAAIEACVRSATDEAAAAYRDQHGLPREARMAVVVQRMVQAEWAGVAFTVDPVRGEADRLVIETVAGNAAGLLAGRQRGARLVLSRPELGLIEGDASFAGMDAIRAVAEQALAAEALFGGPQDVEFAWAGGTTWMLQSRPITTLDAEAGNEFDTPTDDDTEWTSANIQEVLPGLLTPLAISIYRDSARLAYNAGFQELKMMAGDEWEPFIGVFSNRAFLNLSLTRRVADRTFGTSADGIERQYLAGNGERAQREPLARRLVFKMKSALPLARMTFRVQRTVERTKRETLRAEHDVRERDVAALSDAELVEMLDRILAFGGRIFALHLRVSGTALFGFEAVARLLRPVLGDETEGRTPLLFSGLQDIESARITLDLWRLTTVAKNADMAEALGRADFDPGSQEWPDGWRAAWRTFIERHGHRGVNEMEPSAASWRVDPSPVVGIVRSYLGLPERQEPARTLALRQAERERLTTQLVKKMGRIRRSAFRRLLADAQRWVTLRETTKSLVVRAARMSEYVLPEIEKRLVAKGAIDDGGDVFFLTREEISTALRSEDSESLAARVRGRRREFEQNRYVTLPERFRGRPTPLAPPPPQSGIGVLHGTPVSPGIVTGRARVLRSPSGCDALHPGDVLVAPVTDAGWTPLFALASGLVVDLGSALSHGSTVAREYGLPAVVNVRNATGTIRDGDLVTVNGTTGTVFVGDDAGIAS